MTNDQNINFAKVVLWPQCFAALTATIGGLIWGTCIGKLPLFRNGRFMLDEMM